MLNIYYYSEKANIKENIYFSKVLIFYFLSSLFDYLFELW
jgi:hypothetical protein